MKFERPGPVAVATFAVIIGAIAAVMLVDNPPAPRPASASPLEFSAERAMRIVGEIALRPHPAGSAEHDRVRDLLVKELENLGLKVEHQRATGIQRTSRVVAGAVENLMVRLTGTSGGSPVLLATHYDSVAVSPGASDDGAGVAAILESLRALKAGAPLRNDVIALFTDAEEEGLLGAAAFAAEHPWAREVRVAVNLEARGTRGPSLMFETGVQNGLMVRTWAKAVPHPVGSSLTYEIYKRLPNDTDFTVFRSIGISGLNFAFVGNLDAYHTPLDSVANLDRRSLQQQGEATLALARHFGDADLSLTRGPDAVYFSVPFANAVVHYSTAAALPLAGVGLMVWVLAFRHWYRRKHTGFPGLLIGCLVVSAFGAAALFAGLRANRALTWVHERALPEGNVTMSAPYAMALALCALAAWLAFYALLRRRFAAQTIALSSSLVVVMAAIFSAMRLAGASFVALWPLFGALVSILWMPADPTRHASEGGRAFILWLFSVPVILIFPPLTLLLFSAVGLSAEGGAILAIATVISAWMLVPQTELITEGRRFWPAALALVCALGAFVAGAATTRYSPSHPRNDALIYFADTDSRTAFWTARVDRPDPWLAQYLGGAPRPGRPATMIAPWLSASSTAGFLNTPEPFVDLPPPRAELIESAPLESGRSITLRLVPGTAGHLITLWLKGTSPEKAELEGRDASPPVRPSLSWWGLSYANAPQEGIRLKLQLRGTAPVTMTLIDWASGLPANPGRSFAPRPAWSTPISRGDQTLVRREYRF